MDECRPVTRDRGRGDGVRTVRAVAMATSGTHGEDRNRPCRTYHPAVYIRQLVHSAHDPPLLLKYNIGSKSPQTVTTRPIALLALQPVLEG